MWVADLTDEKLYAYRMSDKARDSGKDFDTLSAAGNTTPRGIWSDGTTMWVADDNDGKIYAYRMSDKARDSGNDFDTLDAAGNNAPTGIWSDGTTMWVADSGDDKIYAYRMSGKARDSGNDFDTLTAVGNPTPRGIWSDGTTMWVVDWSDEKIYAYRMSDKARDSDRDFDTLDGAGNETPYDIWSDGTTMWVADLADDKIYAYNMPGSADATLITLVSNLDQGETSYVSTDSDLAQQFTTGMNTSFALSSVDIATGNNSAFALSVCSVNSSGYPTSSCTALAPPDAFASGIQTFTAPANTVLMGNTKYALVIGGTAFIFYGYTRSEDEDPGAPLGWSIKNAYFAKNGSWSTTITGRTLRIAIKGAATGVSTDAVLSDLALEDGDGKAIRLYEAFAPETAAYTVSVANAVARITVLPTPRDDGAGVAYLDADGMPIDDAADSVDGMQVDLAEDANTIAVKVTAVDGATTRTYTLTVTRAATDAATDATLSALSLVDQDGVAVALDKTFAPGTTDYAAVAYGLDLVTVTATPADGGARIEYLDGEGEPIMDADPDAAGLQLEIADGANTITVKVTAADIATTVTYTVTVTRADAPRPDDCTTDDDWCTTLTVGTTNKGYCGAGTGIAFCDYGGLTKDDFLLDGAKYTVESLRWGTGASTREAVHLTLDRDFPEAMLGRLTLVIGTHSLALADAFRGNESNNIDNNYGWVGGTSTEINDLVSGDTITVQLLIRAESILSGVTVSTTALFVDLAGSNTYTVVLDSQPTGEVTVTPSSDNADVSVSGALTFTVLNWSMPQTVTLTSTQAAGTGDGAATVTHSVSGYAGVTTVGSVAVTVIDVDAAVDAYDTNNSGKIESNELLASITDFLVGGGTVSDSVLLGVITRYFTGN